MMLAELSGLLRVVIGISVSADTERQQRAEYPRYPSGNVDFHAGPFVLLLSTWLPACEGFVIRP